MPSVRPTMGALYEDVEQFFGAIFASYGRLLVRHPLSFIISSVLISTFLSFGLFYIKFEFHLQFLYSPTDGASALQQRKLENIYGDDGNNFQEHQQLNNIRFISVILKCNSSHDTLGQYLQHTYRSKFIFWFTKKLSFSTNQTYEDICAKRNKTCVYTIEDISIRNDENNIIALPRQHKYNTIVDSTASPTGQTRNENDTIDKYATAESTKNSKILINSTTKNIYVSRLKFYFLTHQNTNIDEWLKQALGKLHEYSNTDGDSEQNYTICYKTSDSLDQILHKQVNVVHLLFIH